MSNTTPSQAVRDSGLPDLMTVTRLTGVSRQTLRNWYHNKPDLFKVVLRGCRAYIEGSSVSNDTQR